MTRQFCRADHEATLAQEIKLDDALPADHLSRFVVDVIKLLDLSKFYAHYAASGGLPYEPELLLGLLVYGYATGVFSSRGIETATYERLPFRHIAGGWHPDHDTINTFRQTFLTEITNYAEDQDLLDILETIVPTYITPTDNEEPLADEVDTSVPHYEGAKRTITVNAYERMLLLGGNALPITDTIARYAA